MNRMETKRLLVRPLNAKDTDSLYTVLSDSEVMRHVEAPYSRQNTADFIERVCKTDPIPVYAVVWKDTGAVIGHLIYHPFDKVSWELGWILRRDVWNMGLASELTAAVIEDAQANGIAGLVIECSEEQLASRRIAAKHGFQFAGEENGLLLFRRRLENT